MKNRATNILKIIARSIRSNLGWKIVSLAFAILLWNYVIGAVNPTMNRSYSGLQARIIGADVLRAENLTLQGNPQIKDITVKVELHRRDVLNFHKSDIDVYMDVSTINKEGEAELRLRATPSKGTVVSISPDRVKLTVEPLLTRTIPVECELTGELPKQYWRDAVELSKDQLTITGATSLVEKVDRAVVSMPLDGLTESVSAPKDFSLRDANNQPVDATGMTFSDPNSIVYLTIYPMKTVRIEADSAITGTVAKGYEIKSIDVAPTSVVVAGPAKTLAALEEVTVAQIDVSDARNNLTAYQPLELPKGVTAVNASGATVDVNVGLKMTDVTLSDLPVTITGVDSTLKVATPVHATAIVTCPELAAEALRAHPSRIKLYADASGLAAGTHSLAVRAEVAPAASETGVEAAGVQLQPEKVLVNLAPAG